MRLLPYALVLGASALVSCSRSTQGDTGPPAGPTRNPVQPGPSDVRFTLDQGRFSGDPFPLINRYFDMILGDMDLDGDLDLFLNRHNLQRPEVFEYVGDTFEQFNRQGSDLSGLYDNPGIAEMYGGRLATAAAIDAHGVPGIYVWHEPQIDGHWLFRIIPAPSASEHTLTLVTNRPITEVLNLATSERTLVTPFELEVTVDVTGGTRQFELDNVGVNTQLRISTTDLAPIALFVGTQFKEFPSRIASLWKQDPHGLALVDGVGGPEPDLFISGGGLTGNHLPPHDPQADRFLEFVQLETVYEEVPEGVIPADYGRGRQVMWVDFDADGVNELYVSNRQTPNVLLEMDSSGQFQDIAGENALDLVAPDAYAWTDVDQDGQLDLVYLDGQSIGVGYRRGTTFEHEAGTAVGLDLPAGSGSGQELFENTTFHLFDMDRDGDLDLWLSRASSEERLVAFRNDGGTYTLETDGIGLAGASGHKKVVLTDVDNDGWMDVVAYGAELGWWRNLLGESFEYAALDEDFNFLTGARFIDGDVDQDGRVDFVAITTLTRVLVRNRTEGDNTLLEVHPDLPLGTVIRAYHPDGTVFAQQWGAVNVTRYSQSLQPLRFGQAPGVPVLELGVQLPGDTKERYRIEVPRGSTDINL